MARGTINRIEEAFGWRGFPDGLFYAADHGLRFELAGDVDEYALRFVRAIERARVVAGEFLSGSENLTAVITHHGDEKRSSRGAASLKKLKEIGFHADFGPPDRMPEKNESYAREFGTDLYRYWYSADFEKTEGSITALIWAAIAREMAITPKAQWLDGIYIVDFQRRLAICPYDDRGLDVIAPDRASLQPLYEKLNTWLLDYDSKAMDAKFR
jgi:hypothetical protein